MSRVTRGWDSGQGFCVLGPTPHICEHSVTAAVCAPRTSGFLLVPICGIHTPERHVNSYTVCCTPYRHREGGR
jgi:hypothetical protein